MTRPDILTATVRIAATPAEVFPYLVDPRLLVQWLGDWADLNPEPGGVFAVNAGAAQVRGTFLSVEPPNRVVFTWGVPGSGALPAGASTVEIRLKADGNETVVELFHHDLPSNERPHHEAGWTLFLSQLRQAAGS